MTEPFRVPEPSEAAAKAGIDFLPGEVPPTSHERWHFDRALRAAYAVDVPAIVRAEVERALVEQSLATGVHPSIRDWRDKYLAARFPAAAPEPDDRSLVSVIAAHEFTGLSGVRPTPSAPAETGIVCRVAGCGRTVFTAMAGTCDICLNIEREARRRMVDPPSVPAEPQKDGLWAEAEREFVRALALWAKANVPKEYRDVHYAARRLLEAK